MKNFRFRAGDNIQTVSIKGEINLCYRNLQNSNIIAISLNLIRHRFSKEGTRYAAITIQSEKLILDRMCEL